MATILKGAPVVAAMNERNALLCEQLKAKGITPTLAVVRVGEREDDLSYERGVMTRCGKVGVAVRQFVLPADATQEQLLRVLDEVNTDDGIHGCLLFRPLPKQFDDRTVRAALRPEKDVDGITDGSLAGVFTNTELGYAPCTAQACMEILKYYNVPLSGKRAVVWDAALCGQASRHDAGPGKCHRDPVQLPHPEPARSVQTGRHRGGGHGQNGGCGRGLPAGRPDGRGRRHPCERGGQAVR